MVFYFIQRIFQVIQTVFLLSLFIFFIIYIVGSPAYIFIQPDADFIEIQRIEETFGFNLPFYEQYFTYIGQIFSGNFGTSYYYHESVLSLIVERLPATIELTCLAFCLALIVGFPLGVWAGFVSHKKPLNKVLSAVSIMGFSMPNFWQALLLIMFFSVFLQWLPSFGRGETINIAGAEWSIFTQDGFRHLILPAVNLSIFKMCLIFRMSKMHIFEIRQTEYYRFARARGLKTFHVFRYHMLKSLLFLLITVFSVEFVSLITFATVTESIFSWPGIGKLLIDAVLTLDRPIVMTYLILTVCLFVVVNFFVDCFYLILDPRYRSEMQEKQNVKR